MTEFHRPVRRRLAALALAAVGAGSSARTRLGEPLHVLIRIMRIREPKMRWS